MGLGRTAGENVVTMNRPTYEPKETRARKQRWLKAGVWVILAIFILTSGGLVILGGFR